MAAVLELSSRPLPHPTVSLGAGGGSMEGGRLDRMGNTVQLKV